MTRLGSLLLALELRDLGLQPLDPPLHLLEFFLGLFHPLARVDRESATLADAGDCDVDDDDNVLLLAACRVLCESCEPDACSPAAATVVLRKPVPCADAA